ncbi:MAG: hypothetical protein K2H04_00145 [Bacteroidaceae bacterium]|nr:hypothetical protein [Bacteroidaceae bacterium]
MSPTPIGRSRGHRSVGVGDSDLEVVEAHCMWKCLTCRLGTKKGFLFSVGGRDL